MKVIPTHSYCPRKNISLVVLHNKQLHGLPVLLRNSGLEENTMAALL